MKSSFYLTLSLSAVIIFSACRKTANAPQLQSQAQDDALANTTKTVIYKFSFETNDHDTSFTGWTGPFYGFSKDVPPKGGVWSLQLYPELIPYGGYAEHVIKTDTGSYRLRFSCYTKIQSNSANTGIGYLRLIKESISTTSNQQRKTLAETSFSNHDWEVNYVTADVNIKPGDVIIIQVSAGVSELIAWTTLFDRVKVEKLPSTHTIF